MGRADYVDFDGLLFLRSCDDSSVSVTLIEFDYVSFSDLVARIGKISIFGKFAI